MSLRNDRAARGRLLGNALWVLLVVSIIAWALFLWHPWIDWFGRPR